MGPRMDYTRLESSSVSKYPDTKNSTKPIRRPESLARKDSIGLLSRRSR